MTTIDDLRRICLRLPGTSEGDSKGQIGFSVVQKGKLKGYAWNWMERLEPKKARIVNQRVLAVRVPSQSAKELLLASDEVRFFTEPHYNGFPAILVRLDAISPDEIEGLLIEAWRCMADKSLIAEFDQADS